jgi:hypothetical protein
VSRLAEAALSAALNFQLAEMDFEKRISGRSVDGKFADSDWAEFTLRKIALSGEGCRCFRGEEIFKPTPTAEH